MMPYGFLGTWFPPSEYGTLISPSIVVDATAWPSGVPAQPIAPQFATNLGQQIGAQFFLYGTFMGPTIANPPAGACGFLQDQLTHAVPPQLAESGNKALTPIEIGGPFIVNNWQQEAVGEYAALPIPAPVAPAVLAAGFIAQAQVLLAKAAQVLAVLSLMVVSAFLSACTSTQFANAINLAETILDGAITLANIAGVIPVAIGADIDAAETCLQVGLPAFEAGGNVGTILQSTVNACATAVAPVIPAGSDQALATKITAEAQEIASILKTLNITLPATAEAVQARAVAALAASPLNWMDRLLLRRTISKLKSHQFAQLTARRV
jgi:hypothetical protein